MQPWVGSTKPCLHRPRARGGLQHKAGCWVGVRSGGAPRERARLVGDVRVARHDGREPLIRLPVRLDRRAAEVLAGLRGRVERVPGGVDMDFVEVLVPVNDRHANEHGVHVDHAREHAVCARSRERC